MMSRVPDTLDMTILSPLFFGDASGAAVYYSLLARHMLGKGMGVSVISDKEVGEFSGLYHPLFPRRCGQEKQFIRDLLAYATQNIDYLRISALVKHDAPRSLLVHSSFYNHPGLFPAVMRNLKKRMHGCHFVADVRDRLLPNKRVAELNIYDNIIACSENVARHLMVNGVSDGRITGIPVIQEKLKIESNAARAFLASNGLNNRPYILYVGLVKEAKGVGLLMDAYLRHVRSRMPDVALVICGLMKSTDSRLKASLKDEKGVLYLGARSRAEVLQLMWGASVCVNLSPNEGMPRSSLEALALKRPVILPPNVPEFSNYCPDFVVNSRKSSDVAGKIIQVLESGVVANYPVELHYPENVFPAYMNALELNK